MLSCRLSRLSLAWVPLVVGLVNPAPILAQAVDSVAGSSEYTVDGDLLNELPVDRAFDALVFLPGVSTYNDGELQLRGSKPFDAALYLDGVSIISGFRARPFFGLSISGNLESRPSVAPNLVDAVSVIAGPLSASLGNGQAGAISVRTRLPQSRLTGDLRYETDETFGSGHSFGLNRIEGRLEAVAGRVGFMLGGLLEGQRSVERGFGSDDAPVFVLAGLDTTVAVPVTPGDPFSDTSRVAVYDFAASRGRCDDFARSNNPDIAANYEFSCHGSHTPLSPVSSYELAGKLTYGVGRTRVSLLALADQHQNRNFDYGTLYNALGATGSRASSSVVILGWSQQLNRTEERPLLLQANLSFQSDRDRDGPLAPEGEQDTRDPFAGFLLSPLDLRFDFDNFPVDEELLRNYRTNQVGSRRSPYDLENTSQYFTVDQYRNNAYGLYNRDEIAPVVFPESGGPLGFLTLYRENRTLGSATMSWRRTDSHRLQLGAEFTRYSISNYSHFLESQNVSDVYIEHPVRGAVFLENWWRFGEATITTGLRYDFFDTRARRPAFPRISSHPSFNPADPDAFFTDDEFFPRDQSHHRLSPRIQVSYPVAPKTVFRGGFATQVQVPDFRLSLLHLNTDLAITDANTPFGTDLDFERTTAFEVGLRHQLSSHVDVDLSVYSKSLDDQLGSGLVPRFDPLLGTNRNLRIVTNNVEERIRGVDLRVEGQIGSALTGWLGYSYQDGTTEQASGLGTVTRVATLESRPHSVVGALALTVPPNWRPGTVTGAILRNIGIYTTFRVASGTPYTSCSSGSFSDNSVISPDLCSVITSGSLNEARLPTYKQLDLRLAKHFGPGGRFAGYLDARNLLNFKNVLAVFAVTGEPTNPAEVNINWSADSADLASEAQQNAAYSLNGSITLGPALADPRLACTTWTDAAGTPSAPNCVYLIRAEERFGNGDHLFDLTEQRRASEALYRAVRGEQEFTGPPRRIRVGLEVGF